MYMMRNKWISFPAIGVILLALVQAGYSIYMDRRAASFVEGIAGEQAGPIMNGGANIEWEENVLPPYCPVVLDFLWEHESGFSILEEPEVAMTATLHTAVSKGKSGHISFEPIHEEVIKLLHARSGEWHYKILFKFDCKLINIDYLSWIDFSHLHVTQPVIFIIEDTNET